MPEPYFDKIFLKYSYVPEFIFTIKYEKKYRKKNKKQNSNMCLKKQTFMHTVDTHKLNELGEEKEEKKNFLLELGSYTTLVGGYEVLF